MRTRETVKTKNQDLNLYQEGSRNWAFNDERQLLNVRLLVTITAKQVDLVGLGFTKI